MSFKIFNFKDLVNTFWKKVGLLIILIPCFILDGKYFNSFFSYGQEILSLLSFIAFLIFFKRGRKRVKAIYLCVLFFSPLVEYLMSLGLDMYTYRKHNIPIYVFFMHAICIGRLFEFSKEKIVKLNEKAIINWLFIFFLIHNISFLMFFNDIFGFVMSLGVIFVLIIRPKYKLLFLTYHLVIAFAEIFGVYYQAWYWPPTAFNTFTFLPSHSPPSGISLFYYILEIGAFGVYILFHQNQWQRFKKINLNSNSIN